jgi:hypothetical protein
MSTRSGKMGRMRVKTASPDKASRPAAKQRPARDKGVISLKSPDLLPRTAKRPAQGGRKQATATETAVAVVETPTASELKTMRLERIKERAGVKRPDAPSTPVAAPRTRPVRKRKTTSEETPTVAAAPAPEVREDPPVAVLEVAPAIPELEAPPPPAVVMEAAPVEVEASAVVMEAAPVEVEASAVVMEAPTVEVEVSAVVMEAPLVEVEAPAAVDATPAVVDYVPPPLPAVTALAAPAVRAMSAMSNRRSWSPPKARRRASLPVTLAVRLISKLLRWSGVLRR